MSGESSLNISELKGDTRTIYGPNWVLDMYGQPITLNSERYMQLLREKVWPQLDSRRDIRRIWWQQDGATSHCTTDVLGMLQEKFGDRIISRRASTPWPAQSPDLNPLDYWFWGEVTSVISKERPSSIEELMDVVECFCASLSSEQILKATSSIYDRLQACGKKGGNHFQHTR